MLGHFGFLVAILVENVQNGYNLFFLIMGFLLLRITYKKVNISAEDHSFEDFVNIGFVFVGAITTYVLHWIIGWNVVFSASIVGLIFSFIPNLMASHQELQNLPAAVYCGTFVGMTKVGDSPNFLFISIASILTGLILLGTKNAFHGYGGKLGSLAFVGVGLAFYFYNIVLQ